VNASQLFRLSLKDARRRLKRSELYRHREYGVGELFDPLEPGRPFFMQALVGQIEKAWHFSRRAVPEHIKLFTGRQARLRALLDLKKEYDLDPIDRFFCIENSIKCTQFQPDDPSTWDTGFFCVILPGELRHAPMPIFWAGTRSSALTNPIARKWFFAADSEIMHGAEALRFARQHWRKMQGKL
jgi:hypothetical protein